MDVVTLQFKSGRIFYTLSGYIAINEKLQVSIDGDYEVGIFPFEWMDAEYMKKFEEDDLVELHEDDMIELAHIMIERWKRFELMARERPKKRDK